LYWKKYNQTTRVIQISFIPFVLVIPSLFMSRCAMLFVRYARPRRWNVTTRNGRTRLNPLWSRSLQHGRAIIFNSTATSILSRVHRDILLPLRQTSSALPLSALATWMHPETRGGTALSWGKFCRCQRTFGELSVPLLDRVPRSSNHLIDLHLRARASEWENGSSFA